MLDHLSADLRALSPQRANLKSDFVAGLTFAIVNVPQAMAHALLATVNPVLGIYTLMTAVPVAAIFTSSEFMNVSTTAALSLAAGDELAIVPADDRMTAMASLVLLVGLIQLAAGLLRFGFVLRFVSNAVMTGFLNGVAVLIILGQLGALTGYQSGFSNIVARTLDLFLNVGRIHIAATVIGGLTMAVIVLLLSTPWRKFAFVIAIAASTLLLATLSFSALGTEPDWRSVMIVRHIASIPRDLPKLALPSSGYLLTMLMPAVSVAIIGLIQGAGVSQGYPNPDGKYPDVSRDFLGQGVGNIATSLVSGLPAGGSISGTVLVLGAGGRSRWSNVFAGVCVAFVVLLGAPLAELVPMPALAALLIVAGYQGLRIGPAMTIWNTSRASAAGMTMTFFATLFLPLHYAVLLGVAFSVLLHVVGQSNRTKVAHLMLVPAGFPEERPPPKALPSDQLTVLILYGSLFFAAAKSIESLLPAVDNTRNAVIALVLRGQPEVGSTFIAVLQRYAAALRMRDSKLMLVGIDAALRDQLARTGLLETIGEENVFLATPQIGAPLNQAVAAAQAWLELAPGSK